MHTLKYSSTQVIQGTYKKHGSRFYQELYMSPMSSMICRHRFTRLTRRWYRYQGPRAQILHLYASLCTSTLYIMVKTASPQLFTADPALEDSDDYMSMKILEPTKSGEKETYTQRRIRKQREVVPLPPLSSPSSANWMPTRMAKS